MLLNLLFIWGFYAHTAINTEATFLLPDEMYSFFKENLSEIKSGATKPDQRRSLSEEEAGKHYIDIELYGDSILNNYLSYDEALLLFGEDAMLDHGYAPWNLVHYYYRLRNAFEEKNADLILKYAGEIGHYTADLHVPLHTTENYNGQLSNQYGIHSFWETTLPEKFINNYTFSFQEVVYIQNPLDLAWKITTESHLLVNKVLNDEKEIAQQNDFSSKMVVSRRGRTLQIQANDEYARIYHEKLGGMVEERMRLSILRVASIWYSCWVDAGQPNLENMKKKRRTKKPRKEL